MRRILQEQGLDIGPLGGKFSNKGKESHEPDILSYIEKADPSLKVGKIRKI